MRKLRISSSSKTLNGPKVYLQISALWYNGGKKKERILCFELVGIQVAEVSYTIIKVVASFYVTFEK